MKSTFPPLIFGFAIIISVWILRNTVINRNEQANAIHVTGLGKKDFTSDLIVWSGSFYRKNYDLETANRLLSADRTRIQKYLMEKGIAEEVIVFSSVNINKEFDYSYNDKGFSTNTFTGYNLNQRIQIESKEVEKVESLSRSITDLITFGIEFYSESPQYYYTGLAELKIEMIAAATEDARVRAEQIAENANAKIGDLQEASMGVFQIIAQNSSEDYSWGGTYNTSAKQKTATITMRLKFGIR